MKDSGNLAQAGSALVCELAMGMGAWDAAAYVDDLLNSAPAQAALASRDIVSAAMDLCVPGGEAMDKRSAPASAGGILIGRVVDLERRRVYIPLKKYYTYTVHLLFVERCLGSADPRVRAAITSSNLEKLTGKLGYLAEFSPGSRPHLHALYKQGYAPSPPGGALRDSILGDLAFWSSHALAGTLRVSALLDPSPGIRVNVCGGGRDLAPGARPGPAVQQSDAGDPAGAAICDGHAVVLLFTPEQRKWSSDRRELYTIVNGVRRFVGRLRGKQVVLISDHAGNCANINKGNAESPPCRDLICELYQLCAEYDITFVAAWIPCEFNAGPDQLASSTSRADAVDHARHLNLILDD